MVQASRSSLLTRSLGFFRSGATVSPAITGPAAAIEKRSDTSTLGKPAEWLMLAMGGQTSAGVSVGPDGATGLSAAYACVDLRARLLASLPVKLYRRESRGRTEIPDHPASQLLRSRPNGAQTPFSFFAHAQKTLDTRGNAVALVARDAFGDPTALIPVKPVEIDPLMTDSGDVVYRYRGRQLTRRDVLHVAGNDLRGDGIWGVSPISRLRETFGLAMATEQFAARMMANDATPPLALSTPGKVTDDQIEALRAQWNQRHNNLNGTRPGPAILTGGLTPVDLGFTAQDTQLLESRAFDVDQIARIYGVPGELVGAKGASSWGTGIGEKIMGFVKFTIGTLVVNWEQSLDLTLLTDREREGGMFFAFNLDALLRGDLKTRTEIYKTLREIAAIDVNQIRELEDWSLYPDSWAGDPRQPLNNQGGGNPTTAKPAAAPAAES